jgi:hypothetical protein
MHIGHRRFRKLPTTIDFDTMRNLEITCEQWGVKHFAQPFARTGLEPLANHLVNHVLHNQARDLQDACSDPTHSRFSICNQSMEGTRVG